jgi:hypothetical protein
MNLPSSPRLADLARHIDGSRDPGTKPEKIWNLYEDYLPPFREKPIRMLEIGVHQGVSARVFSRYFPNGLIVAIDIALPPVDQCDFPNLHLIECDQTDGVRLMKICDHFAPDGFDIIIDDASHVGAFSLTSYQVLFPYLKPRGLYFIEDWGTGYLPTEKWGDGALPSAPQLIEHNGFFARRILSHDHGMAGFVKVLIDEIANGKPKVIRRITVHDLFVVLEKVE